MALLEIIRRLSTTQVEVGRHARPEGRAPDVVADVAPGHPTQPPLGLVQRRADRLAGMPAFVHLVHQQGRREVIDGPQARHDALGPREQEPGRQAHILVDAIHLEHPALAPAQDAQPILGEPHAAREQAPQSQPSVSILLILFL